MNTNFGWKKDKYDKKDFIHPTEILIPDVFNLEGLLPNVRDQGNIGSCVGFALGANLVTWAKKQKVYTQWFSPTWIYNGARFLEGTLLQDDGCYPKDALNWLVLRGGLLEEFWPYDPTKLDTKAPPSSLWLKAAQYPLLAYYRVVDGIDGICSAIFNGACVSIGTPWFYEWIDPYDGILQEPTTSFNIAGGHETTLYGYDRIKKVVYGINSWGTAWGHNGLFTMPFNSFEVFKQLGGYDAHYISVAWDQPIPPVPPPDPDEDDSNCPLAKAIARGLNFIARNAGSNTRLKAIRNKNGKS